MNPFEPAYIETYRRGLLNKKIRQVWDVLNSCTLCPRECGVDRLSGEKGVCQTGELAIVSSYNPHFGEERPLVGQHGSGTIFFAGCNLLCIFCQNFDISHEVEGVEWSPEVLAKAMLSLQEAGCCNINFVTPSHVVPQILEALVIAAGRGLHLPLVYNSSGYDSIKTLQLLDGIVDIYMPDCKFMSRQSAARYTGASDYPEVMQAAVLEMHRQVGELVLDKHGIAVRGLLVRHLVMPGCLQDTQEIVHFLATEVSRETYVNIMDQYHPCYRAGEFDEINRSLSRSDYKQAMKLARQTGLHRFDEKNVGRMLKLLLKK